MSKDLIRISLRAYDHKLLDKSAEKIIRTAKSTGAIISGPIPLPTKRNIYQFNTILTQRNHKIKRLNLSFVILVLGQEPSDFRK